jgi:TRAP-type mannitol/chloroaromatic compound transport system permease small subunit
MVIITFIVVVLRYAFDIGWIALQESVTYLHAMVFLIGASWAMQQEAHVRVDIFYSRMSEKHKALVDLVGSILMLLPVMLFITWVSWEYVIDSWDVLEGSREAGGLPAVFLLKTLILVMSALLILQGLVQIVRSAQALRESD